VVVEELRRQVADRVPIDDRERHSQERFLAELDRLEQPFEEHADPTHVTASAIVIGPQGVLLHLHHILHKWMQPGGHIDAGESPAEAALREMDEETGLTPLDEPELVHIDVHAGPRGHTHLDVRYLVHADGDPHPAEGESPEVRWFDWDEALSVVDESLAGILQVLRQRQS
jgi:8-oxo-dGTP pyrophosphatase MutT (NUDIX family)